MEHHRNRHEHHSASHEHIIVRFRYDWMNEIWERKVPFLAVFFVVVSLTYGVLYALDVYPELTFDPTRPSEWLYGGPIIPDAVTESEPSEEEVVAEEPEETPSTIVVGESAYPTRLIIDKLDRDVRILNPKQDTVEALDAALLEGIVRHPDSADFKNVGTMFLLGHSSYLPTVRNRNFQALNGIQKLEWGDTIRIQSKDTEYLYRVQKVYEAKASNAEADIQWDKAELVMVTCDSFGSKDDRFVVEAYLVESYPLDTDRG